MLKQGKDTIQKLISFGFKIRDEKTTIKKPGLPPGSLIYVGKEKATKAKIEIIDYTKNKFTEKTTKKVEECYPFKKKPTVTWLNIVGINDIKVIENIGSHFDIHPLVLEDILNTNQRPKIEDFGEYIFLVLKMVNYDAKANTIDIEQVSIILGKNFVISFQEKEGDVFDLIRARIRNKKAKIRGFGNDYLLYALIDAIVDNYFTVLEQIGEKIETLEDEVLENPSSSIMSAVHSMKRELIFLRKSVWPLREVINNLQRGETKLIDKHTQIYLRDVYDHTIQVIDAVETFRDMASGLADLYLSSISNKMNEVMKILTIFAAIFIPLTFIAGVYGMNFYFMPELKWRYGYFAVWGIIFTVALGMLLYFKKKKWI